MIKAYHIAALFLTIQYPLPVEGYVGNLTRRWSEAARMPYPALSTSDKYPTFFNYGFLGGWIRQYSSSFIPW